MTDPICLPLLPVIQQFFFMLSHSEPDDKIYAFAEEMINLTEKSKDVFERVENIVEKGKCCLPAFSPFPTMFPKVRVVKN